MSLGLPSHLAPHRISAAIASAQHWIAAVCLTAALLGSVAVDAVYADRVTWPIIFAVLPMLLLLGLLARRRTMFWTVSYLLVGSASTYLFAVVTLVQIPIENASDSFLLTLIKVALITVGGVGTAASALAAWSLAGYVLGEAVVLLAAVQTGHLLRFDVSSALVLLLLLLLLLLVGRARRTARRAQPSLHRAARDEGVAQARAQIELRAAALIHDIVLSDLAAVASATPGPLAAAMRAQIERDLIELIGQDWLPVEGARPGGAGPHWSRSQLAAAVRFAEQKGLTVQVTGDLSVVGQLTSKVENAVGLAVRQCLANVLGHAGVSTAEVVVYRSEREASVMVIDAGRGFIEADTASDRLGLRQSVRARMESVGGRVQVWSAPGRGTSVMIQAPLADSATEPVHGATAATVQAGAEVPSGPAVGARPGGQR